MRIRMRAAALGGRSENRRRRIVASPRPQRGSSHPAPAPRTHRRRLKDLKRPEQPEHHPQPDPHPPAHPRPDDRAEHHEQGSETPTDLPLASMLHINRGIRAPAASHQSTCRRFAVLFLFLTFGVLAVDSSRPPPLLHLLLPSASSTNSARYPHSSARGHSRPSRSSSIVHPPCMAIPAASRTRHRGRKPEVRRSRLKPCPAIRRQNSTSGSHPHPPPCTAASASASPAADPPATAARYPGVWYFKASTAGYSLSGGNSGVPPTPAASRSAQHLRRRRPNDGSFYIHFVASSLRLRRSLLRPCQHPRGHRLIQHRHLMPRPDLPASFVSSLKSAPPAAGSHTRSADTP